MNETETAARRIVVSTKIDADEYDQLSALSLEAGLSRSAYVRHLIKLQLGGTLNLRSTDPAATMAIAAIVSERLLGAIPRPVLEDAVIYLRKKETKRRPGTSGDQT